MADSRLLGASSIETFLLAVAMGEVGGHEVLTIPGRSTSAIDNNELQDIAQHAPTNGVLARPGGVGVEIVSSSANDTSTGTGIQTADMAYLDVNLVQQVETFTMNGLTAVPSVATDIEDVQWLHGKTIGAIGNQTAAGNIHIRGLTDTPIYEMIAAGGNQSLTARYRIPAGKTAYILGWHCTATTKPVDFRLRANIDKDTREVITPFLFQDALIIDVGTSPYIPLYNKISGKATVKVSGISTAAGGPGSATFFLLLVDNDA